MTVEAVATNGKIRNAKKLSLRMDRLCCNDRLDAILGMSVKDMLNNVTIWILTGRVPLSGVKSRHDYPDLRAIRGE